MNERDEATIERENLKARLAGKIGSDGTRFGSADGSRSMVAAPSTSRRRCGCGCSGRATHTGLGDGVALMGGCEMRVRRWVRDGYTRTPL
jgi:Lon protease-like protein